AGLTADIAGNVNIEHRVSANVAALGEDLEERVRSRAEIATESEVEVRVSADVATRIVNLTIEKIASGNVGRVYIDRCIRTNCSTCIQNIEERAAPEGGEIRGKIEVDVRVRGSVADMDINYTGQVTSSGNAARSDVDRGI